MHKALFWVAMAVLQLDEVNLYSAGTALLEQNLHTLDSLRVFNDKVRRQHSAVPDPEFMRAVRSVKKEHFLVLRDGS